MVWDYSVTEPGEFGSKSTSYLVTVTTDLAEYGAGAAGAGPGEGNGAGEAKGGEAGLKVLQCRRRYSDFDRLHKNLRKLVGVKALPKYPAKALFNRFNDKVIQDRIAFFLALLKVIADSEALQRSEPVLEFVCKVPEPDYEEVKELVLEKARWVLSLPEEEWTLVGAADQPHGAAPAEKGAAVIKMRKMENSRFRSIKSTMFIPRPYKAVAAIYDDHSQWKNWTKEIQFRRVASVDSPRGRVINATYKVPLIDDRDTCVFTLLLDRTPLDPEGVLGAPCWCVCATSIEHPLVPRLRGVERAEVLISVIILEPRREEGGAEGGDAEGCQFTSIVHSDPKGQVPAAIVNQALGSSHQTLAAMKRYMLASIPAP